MPALAGGTSGDVCSVAGAIGVVIVMVLLAAEGCIWVEAALISHHLALAAQPLGFLRRHTHGLIGRGRGPGALAPPLAFAMDVGGGAQ